MGVALGSELGEELGSNVGSLLGETEELGSALGFALGFPIDGLDVGFDVVGLDNGLEVGPNVGFDVGFVAGVGNLKKQRLKEHRLLSQQSLLLRQKPNKPLHTLGFGAVGFGVGFRVRGLLGLLVLGGGSGGRFR